MNALLGFWFFIVLLTVWYFWDVETSTNEVRQEAFERGYMVECLGKSGYFWECAE